MIRLGQAVAGQLATESLGELGQSRTFTQYDDLQSALAEMHAYQAGLI